MSIKQLLLYGLCMLCIIIHARDCYIMVARSQHKAGFFSIFNTVIGALDFIDTHNSEMIIDFECTGLYYDSSMGPNWWSYYFEPIPMSTKQDLTYKMFKQYQLNTVFTLSATFAMSPARAHELITKYIRIKPHIAHKIDTFVQEHFNDCYVIGIHYRGTDKSSEAPEVSYQDVYKQVIDAMQQVHDKPIKIFVATDDALFLTYISEQFGAQVCALDALRSSDGKPVHYDQSLSGYQKGEDALLDCILLSKTNLLIKMSSNLSDSSVQFNPNIPVIRLNTGYFE